MKITIDSSELEAAKLSDGLLALARGLEALARAMRRQSEAPRAADDASLDEFFEHLLEADPKMHVRIYNALVMGGIKTLGELRAASPQDLRRCKNLGRKSIDAITNTLAHMNSQGAY